jgi:uncharacterized integral membrane protein
MRTGRIDDPAAPPDPQTISGAAARGGSDPAPLTVPNTARAREAAAASSGQETGTERFRRKALRGRLHGYAIATVALVAVLIALAASNTAHVKVNWLIGSSHVSLVWLVLIPAILGWVLGLMTSARFRWRTRAPRGRGRRGARGRHGRQARAEA